MSDAGSELYVMEQFLDYRMVEDRSVVEQAHEIHTLAKDLKKCSKESPCVLPDKFVAGGIISKLPPSWRDFATSLKHKRQEFTIDGLIGTLHVEKKARAKDIRGKGVVGASSANLVQKNNSHKNKKSHRRTNKRLSRQPPSRRRRRRELAMCALVRNTLLQSVRTAKATTSPTWSLASLEEHRGTIIYYLQFFQFFFTRVVG